MSVHYPVGLNNVSISITCKKHNNKAVSNEAKSMKNQKALTNICFPDLN